MHLGIKTNSNDVDNYFYNAVIGLIVPGENIFTYEQITCELCKEVGFASIKTKNLGECPTYP